MANGFDKGCSYLQPRWWFQICFIFTTIWGRFPIWLIFLTWVETTNQKQLTLKRSWCFFLPSHWFFSTPPFCGTKKGQEFRKEFFQLHETNIAGSKRGTRPIFKGGLYVLGREYPFFWTPSAHEKWRFYTKNVWVITPKNEGNVGSHGWWNFRRSMPTFVETW